MSYPDVAKVRRDARREWEKLFKRALSIEERIGESTPWWIVVVALVFFALSVPHTMAVFDKITPDWGKVAPFGIEFGLLFASFRRRVGKMTVQLWTLEVLLFITAIIVNGAGSLEAVVNATKDVQGQSITELVRQLPTLPATSQVALVLVPVAALIIPIGTVSAGEGLAALVLERRTGENLLDARWKEVSAEIEFEALRDAAIALGHTPNSAAKWAAQITGFRAPGLSARPVRTPTDSRTEAGETPNGQRLPDARKRVRRFIDEHPEAVDLSARQLAKASGVGKTIAAEELSAYKQIVLHSNGNGHAGEGEG